MNDNDDYVSIEIKKRVEYFKEFLSLGKCKDYIDYQFVHGQIEGMRFCLDVIKELKQKMEDEENKT